MASTPNITNIIVVMLENRSYDNVLGWLYNSANAPPYNQAPAGQADLNGLTGSESNPNPIPPPETISITNAAATNVPNYDPGELFCDMAQQFLGLPSIPTTDPYTNPPSKTVPMQGFTTNYAALTKDGKPIVPAANYGDCITYLTPAQVPVTAFLASNFAVCDQWFASVPCQTFTNRNFVHCAGPAVYPGSRFIAPFSLVNDAQYVINNAESGLQETSSIFSALDAAFPNSSTPHWKLYFFDYSIAMEIVPYVYQKAISSSNVNVATYDNTDWGNEVPFSLNGNLGAVPPTFMDDLAAGNLPKLSFIEPRYSNDWAAFPNPPNSNHPGPSATIPEKTDPPTDVADGEAFLMQLYNALRASSYWNTCLLIITYDEHGGLYDHVYPPAAVSPGAAFPPANDMIDGSAQGFPFTLLGGRVPAIIVSPFVPSGSTIRNSGSAPFDHTSVIKTVWDCFNLSSHLAPSTSLTLRDQAAPSVMPFLSATANNTTGPYSGSTLQQTSPNTARIGRKKMPQEVEALAKARIEKSMRGRDSLSTWSGAGY